MRIAMVALLLSSMLVTNATLAGPATPSGATATAQPQLPAVVSDPTGVNSQAGANTKSDLKSIPTPPADRPAELNMKTPKESGGKFTSYLVKDAPLPSDYVKGKQSAKLNLIEYASLSCPHCAHLSSTVIPEIEKQYVDTGKIRYILRQFPLNEPALKGAMLLDCVGEQNNDKYYVFAKVLFDAQNKWAFDSNFLSGLETIASVGGVSKEQFQGCVNNTDREMKVLKLKKLATDELKIPHTPFIIIGDEAYEGDKTVEALSKFIDKKLAEVKK